MMSSRKRLCVRSEPKDRQTFCERICDDLCEEILQYLSLEDKLRLEGVSKQFQRSVFKRHYDLTIYAESSPGKEFESRLYKNNGIDLKALEPLLKKCPNIRSIEFFYENAICYNFNQMVRQITRYCNNLVTFKLPLNSMSASAFKGLQKKFNSKLKFFSEVQISTDLIRMNGFSNVEELLLGSVEFNYEEIIARVKWEGLKRLDVTLPHQKEQLFQKLAENHSYLQLLNLTLRTGDYEVINSVLSVVSEIKDLIHLNLSKKSFLTYNGLNCKLLCDSFKRIGSQCLSLKSFETNLDITSEDILNMTQFLSPLISLKRLKRLNLKLILDINYDSDHFESDVNQIVFFSGFKDLSYLTHLTLMLDELDTFDERLIHDIDINLPNLNYLQITNILSTLPKGVTQMANTLSRLSKLQTIRLEFNNKLVSQLMREEITKKCPKIRTIDIKFADYYEF